MNLWLNYPLSKAVLFLAKQQNWIVKAHVLRIGPVAFLICWRTKGVPQ